jgi:hypothetical protein
MWPSTKTVVVCEVLGVRLRRRSLLCERCCRLGCNLGVTIALCAICALCALFSLTVWGLTESATASTAALFFHAVGLTQPREERFLGCIAAALPEVQTIRASSNCVAASSSARSTIRIVLPLTAKYVS